MSDAPQTIGIEKQLLHQLNILGINIIRLVSDVGEVEQEIGLMQDDMAQIGMRVKGFLVIANVEHGVDSGNVDELARGLIHLVHRVGEVLSRPDNDRHNFIFQQFGKDLVDGKIGIVQLLPYFDVTQVDDMKLRPMVKKLVECLADIVHAIGTAFVVDRTTFFLDADNGQIHTFEVRESVLAAVDIDALAQGLLAWTVGLAETLLSNRLKENADVHSFGLWPMTMAHDLRLHCHRP